MDSPNPLFWDILWFLVFGVSVLAIGFWLRRRPGDNNLSGAGGHIAAIVLAVAVSATGPISAIPPAESRTVMVLFSENTPPEQIFASAAEADARLVWSDRSGRLWAIALSDSGDTSAFYRHGALAVSGNFLTAACLDWTVL